jgi:hypothetical protein
MRPRLVVVVVTVIVSSCGGELHQLTNDVHQLRRVTHALHCQDGAPVRVLIDPACPDGICGISCAPDRWWPVVKKSQTSSAPAAGRVCLVLGRDGQSTPTAGVRKKG